MKRKRPRRSPRLSKSARRARLVALAANPPRGSKLAAAKKYGIDLTLLVENLLLTPTERLQNNYAAAAFHEEMRRAGQRSRAK
jgi:hypothetical protein